MQQVKTFQVIADEREIGYFEKNRGTDIGSCNNWLNMLLIDSWLSPPLDFWSWQKLLYPIRVDDSAKSRHSRAGGNPESM